MVPQTSSGLAAIEPGQRRNLAWLGMAGLLLLFLALRWNNFNVPLIRDEGEYAYAAQLLKSGMAPYEDSFLQKPPMIIYTYALSDVVAPNVFWFPRVLSAVFVALATLLLGAIARREFGAEVALPAMWLMTPLVLLPGIEQFPANTEFFLLLPLMAMLFLYVDGRERGKCSDWFLAGSLAATAFLYKYTVLPILVFVFLAWTFEEWRARTGLRKILFHWFGLFLGAMAASLIILGFFLAKDGGKHLWECTIRFNRYYALSPALHAISVWSKVTSLLSAWWIVAGLIICAFLIRPRPRIWFWGGMALAACVSTGGTYFGHYYILVMPFAALLAAVGITDLAALIAKRSAWPAYLSIRVYTTIAVLLVCLPDLSFILRSKEQFADEKMKAWHSFLEAKAVAEKVSELSSPQDQVYVAGSEPEILYYARRFSPTRFIIAYPFMIPTPLAQGYQREAIRDLQRHPPALIVLALSPTSWMTEDDSPKEFLDYLKGLAARDYDLVGGYVYTSEGGHWQEQPSNASYLLFRRKKS